MSLRGHAAGALERAEAAPPGGSGRWLRLMLSLSQRLSIGSVTVDLPSGQRMEFRGSAPGPAAHVHVRRERMARRLLLGGSIGLAEAYVDGDFDSADLVALLTVAALNEQVFSHDLLHGRSWRRVLFRLLHRLSDNTLRGSRRNIQAHYDLGNAFYEKWLDPELVYSCAVFEGTDDLREAQQRKFQRMASLAEVGPGQRVLEIGCGWGGFAVYLARELGARVTAITISRAQYEAAARLAQQQGLGERLEIRLQDYRETVGQYDRVLSVEMFEAVGERYWPAFFSSLKERLVPGGLCGLQTIVIADRFFEGYRRGTDFIQRYVFPGGLLPCPSRLAQEVAKAGLSWRREIPQAADYVRTLAEWRRRFEAAWPEIEALGFDARFRRLWRYYLSYCEAGFATRTTEVLQIALARG